MLCFFCTELIESDHTCQEIVEYMGERHGPVSVQDVLTVRKRLRGDADEAPEDDSS